MNTASPWPGGWWWGLAFIDFRYFSDKHPPLCLATEGKREERAASSVGCLESLRETDSVAWPGKPLPLYPRLSGFFFALPPESEHIIMHFALFYCIDLK